MKKAYIGIGSNIGDSIQNCVKAVKSIEKLGNITIERSEPVGVDGQDWYVNGVVSIRTDRTARDLLDNLLSIERDMGRIRKEKWEPRLIDLDILLFGNDVIDEPELVVPHSLMHTRRFVLVPLVEIAPDLIHPVFNKAMKDFIGEIPDNKQIIRPVEV